MFSLPFSPAWWSHRCRPHQLIKPPGEWGGEVGSQRGPLAGRDVSTTRACFEAEVRRKPTRWRHRATGAGAPCLLPEAPQGPLQSPSPGLGGPSWDRSCPLDPPVRRGHPGAEGLEEGEGLLTPPPGEFHSLLTPVFTQLSHNLCPSVSRSFCGSLPPSSPRTTDTGPQPSDLGGHRASLIPCPSLTPGG